MQHQDKFLYCSMYFIQCTMLSIKNISIYIYLSIYLCDFTPRSTYCISKHE